MTERRLSQIEKMIASGDRGLFKNFVREAFEKLVIPEAKRNEYRERLDLELQLIENCGLKMVISSLWDIARFLRKNRILFTGPVNLANSLVLHCLGITAIDPIRHGLPFEGFHDHTASKLPDFYFLLQSGGQDRLVTYLKKTYGKDYVHRVYPPSRQRRASKPDISFTTANCAIVITGEDISKRFPAMKGNEGDRIILCERDELRRFDFLYFQCLWSRALDDLDNTLYWIERLEQKPPKIQDIPLSDKTTFKRFAKGKTTGIVHFDNPLLKKLLRRLEPSKFEQLAAIHSLYRPSTIQAGMVDEYIARANGQAQPHFLSYELKPVLEETYGLLIYDEQILQIFTDYAGILAYEAMALIPELKKRDLEKTALIGKQFKQSAAKLKRDPEETSAIWDAVEHFSKYSFSKAKAVSNVMLAYRMQYLYANYNGPW